MRATTRAILAFESTRIAAVDDDTFRITGNLTLHGVTNEIVLTAEINGTDVDPWGNEKVGHEVLMFLGEAPDRRMRMSEIADRVLLSRSGLTRLVDRLVEPGYVTRCAAENDGRGLYAELTDAGADKLHAARRTHHEGIRTFFLDRLSTTDQSVLADIWYRFELTAPGDRC